MAPALLDLLSHRCHTVNLRGRQLPDAASDGDLEGQPTHGIEGRGRREPPTEGGIVKSRGGAGGHVRAGYAAWILRHDPGHTPWEESADWSRLARWPAKRPAGSSGSRRDGDSRGSRPGPIPHRRSTTDPRYSQNLSAHLSTTRTRTPAHDAEFGICLPARPGRSTGSAAEPDRLPPKVWKKWLMSRTGLC